MVTDDDRDMIKSIEKVIGSRLKRIRIDGFNYDARPTNAGRSRARAGQFSGQRKKPNNFSRAPHRNRSKREIRPSSEPRILYRSVHK
jgi:hypothetical protein